MEFRTNLPTGMQLVNSLDKVSKERLGQIIDELKNASANDDDAPSTPKKSKVEEKSKEPVLEY